MQPRIKSLIIFLTFTGVLFGNVRAQLDKKLFFRNNRFVVELTHQRAPGDLHYVTGVKLYEFFNNKLIHMDSSLANEKHQISFDPYSQSEKSITLGQDVNEHVLYAVINQFHLVSTNQEVLFVSENKHLYYGEGEIDLHKVPFSDTVFFTNQMTSSLQGDTWREDFLKIKASRKSSFPTKDGKLGVSKIKNRLFFNPLLNKAQVTSEVVSQSDLQENQTFDIDGNVYNTVKIDGKEWMAENLRAVHFSNGEGIRKSPNWTDWSNLNTPSLSNGFARYESDSTYGYYYNGFALVDERNVCPLGYHVPDRKDIARLYNAVNTYKERVRIKSNGVAKRKIYPRIFAPVIETVGAGLTASIYTVAGVADIVGNLVWATTDFFLLGPVLGWNKKSIETTDSTTMVTTTTKRVTYDPFPTYEIYSWAVNLWDETFHLVLPPAIALDEGDYLGYQDYYSLNLDAEEQVELDYGLRPYSHIDKLRSANGKKLTDEYGFNLSNGNTLMFTEPHPDEDSYVMEENALSHKVVLPFVSRKHLNVWGYRKDHELQLAEFIKELPFINRLGTKVRCVAD